MRLGVGGSQILHSIRIEGLFGYLDYNLSFDGDGPDSNMNLLYGENGSGKTTILRLVHSCLSNSNVEGLRTWLIKVPFKRFHVTTCGGDVIIERDEAAAGPYRFTVRTPAGETVSNLAMDAEAQAAVVEGARLPALLSAIDSLGVKILYLSAERRMRSTLMSLELARERSGIRSRRRFGDTAALSGEIGSDSLNIKDVAWTVLHTFQRQIIAQANVGQDNTNTIYLDLAKRLLSAWADPPTSSNEDFEQLIAEIDKLQASSAPLKEFKSITSVPFEEFKSVLISAPLDRRSDLLRMFQPFLESARARIDALTPLVRAINLLVTEMNSFFSRKVVEFDVSQGFSITSNEVKLPYANLSSGEKHLFLILCATFLSRDARCLFLIDEPELSLNVYWQRNLPRTLQRLIEGLDVQFLMATHSLEILTEFGDRIRTLEN
jgi:energy-coupling factor transporter ATP-binding protein EcfA2